MFWFPMINSRPTFMRLAKHMSYTHNSVSVRDLYSSIAAGFHHFHLLSVYDGRIILQISIYSVFSWNPLCSGQRRDISLKIYIVYCRNSCVEFVCFIANLCENTVLAFQYCKKQRNIYFQTYSITPGRMRT